MSYQFTEIGYYHPFCAPETEVVTITAWFDFPYRCDVFGQSRGYDY